jgi:hypothetical protein
MKFITSLFKVHQKPKSEVGDDKQQFQTPAEAAFHAIEVTNELMTSIYDQQVLPLKEKLVGKIVSKSMVGSTGYVIFFLDGSWIAAYMHEMTLEWKMGEGELSTEIETLLNSFENQNNIFPLPIDKINDISVDVANAYGKEIVSISSGKIHGINYIKFSFPDRGELFTIIVERRENKYSYNIFWKEPLKLIWRGEAIGFLLDQDDDMGNWDGIWESNDTEQAKEFEQLASMFDPKNVIKDLRLGTLLEWQEGDGDHIGCLIVLGLKNSRLFLRSIYMQSSIDWAKKNVI